jgi:hypothetical protein
VYGLWGSAALVGAGAGSGKCSLGLGLSLLLSLSLVDLVRLRMLKGFGFNLFDDATELPGLS